MVDRTKAALLDQKANDWSDRLNVSAVKIIGETPAIYGWSEYIAHSTNNRSIRFARFWQVPRNCSNQLSLFKENPWKVVLRKLIGTNCKKKGLVHNFEIHTLKHTQDQNINTKE